MLIRTRRIVFGEDHLTAVATVEFDGNADDDCVRFGFV